MTFNNQHYNIQSWYFAERLSAALERISRYPLTVIEAPMGYGKTTAVKGYVAKTGVKVLWQTVYDNEAGHFWSGFCKLFAELDGGCACGLAELGLPEDGAGRREAVDLIAGVKLTGPTVLVIDDYHLLTQDAIHDFIVYLARNELSDLFIVLTARMVSLDALDELKIKGLAQHITQELLELAPVDIARYYRSCGVRLKQGDADLLYAYTEGWISALYLCLLGFLQDGRLEKPSNLQELLAKVVYRPLSGELREFLLRLCLFDRFTLSQAQAMWHRDDAATLLRQLMAQNAFIQYDVRNRTYQMHNIFTGYLRELFAALEEPVRREIWRTAGEWHVDAEDYLAAMEAFYQAGDFDRLLTVVEMDKGNSINREHKETIIRYFAECPEEIRQNHPVAGVIYGRELLFFEETEQFFRHCQELVRHIDRIADGPTRNQMAGEMELVFMFTKYNDIAAMAEHVRAASKLLPEASKLCDHNTPWTMGSPSVLYMFYRRSGALQQAIDDLLATMPRYYRLTAGHGLGVEYVMQAEQYYFCGDFENADIVSHKALRAARAGRQIGSVVSALFLRIRLAFAQGDLASVQRLMEELRAEVKASRQVLYLHTADMCDGFVYAHLKQPGNIAEWIGGGEFAASRLPLPAMAFFHTVYGRVLLIAGEEKKLLGLAEHFMDSAAIFANLLSQVYADIYVAAANEKLFRRDAALSALRRALDAALPDGVIMPFVENADFIQPLLEELSRAAAYREGVARIVRLAKRYRQAVATMNGPVSCGAAKPELTEREREIALLAADGLTNREIGAGLGISENTVKTQLKRIFEKLSINSRALLKDYFA